MPVTRRKTCASPPVYRFQIRTLPRYDKALEEYGRANARTKLLREVAKELADELFDFNRKLNERMPLYEAHVSQPAPAAARSLPKPA